MAANTLRITSDGDTRRAITAKIGFTEASVKRAKPRPGKGQTWIHDRQQRGLVLLITPDGHKGFYFYRKQPNGRIARIRIGDPETMSVKQARELAMEYHGKVNDGIDLVAERQKQREDRNKAITVGKLWEQYRDEWLKKTATPSTVRTDESRWDTCLKRWADKRIDTITPEHCVKLHARIAEDRGKSKRANGGTATADKALKLLRRMFNWGKVKPNPCGEKAIQWYIGKNSDERSRYLTADEMRRFLAAVELEPNDTLRDFLKLSLFIGQRRSAMSRMRWDELDLKAGIWRIPAAKAKSKQDTLIPLSLEALAVLNARRAVQAQEERVSEWVFANHRHDPKVPYITEPRYALKRACKKAGITDLRLHDLRRSMGVWQALSGSSELVIGASLGHTDREATRRYSRIAELAVIRASMGKATAAMVATGNEKDESEEKTE